MIVMRQFGTIRIEIRQPAGLVPKTDVEFACTDGVVILCPKAGALGEQLIEALRGAFSGCGMTADDKMHGRRGDD